MYQCSIAIFLAYCFVYQPRLCLGDEKDSTTAKQILAPDNAERLTRLFDPLSREYRIEVAKKEILRKLGMTKRPPKMENLRANIPKPVFDGEISSLFANEDDEPTKTTQVVIPAEEGDVVGCSSQEDCFNFQLTKRIFKNQIIEFATLQFFKGSSDSKSHKVKIEDNNAKGKVVALNRVPVGRDWISLRVEEQMKNWIESRKNLNKIQSFRISCQDCKHHRGFKVSNKPRYRPFLLIKTSERKHKHIRKRRSFSVDCIPGYDKCCRQSLYVTFKEIGWHDWIIEPAGFEVNVCKGRCSGTAIYFAKRHGFVKKELMRKKKNTFLSVCCVPTKFGMLTLLHFDEDGFIFKTTLENMVVKECGCM